MPHSIQVLFKKKKLIVFTTANLLLQWYQLEVLMVASHKSPHLLVSVQRKCVPP